MAMTPGMVGEAFARQYYVVLEQFPEYVYRFYTDASRLTRAEAGAHGLRHMARSPPDICNLVMSSAASGCRAQIKTLDAQESFAGSVFVLVTGTMHKRDTSRSFVQSFFLAPQERGFYVLNDIFRYLDDEPQPINPGSGHSHGDGSGPLNTQERLPTGLSEAVKNHFEVATRVESGTREAFDTSDNGGFPMVKEAVPEDTASHQKVEAHSSERLGQKDQHEVAVDGLRSTGADDVSSERLSYANILRYARDSPARVQATNQAQQAHAKVHSSLQPSYFPQLSSVQRVPHTADEPVIADNEDEVKSVYMNLHSSITEAQLHEDLKKFGAVKRGGIIIRARKDGGSYAFVEFEDTTSALNVIKASPVSIGGHSTWIEAKKSTFEGGRVRGRGQGRGPLPHGSNTATGGGRGSKPDSVVYGGSRSRV